MRNRPHEKSRFFRPRFPLTTILRPGRTFGFLNLAAGAAFALVLACGPDEVQPTGTNDDGPALPGDEEEVFIVDRTGKKWEVSHAWSRYGMEPSLFQYGLGPDAIQPVNGAAMTLPGEEGYPDGDETFAVLGFVIGGDARAYGIRRLSRHEVVNEALGEAHVSPAY